MLPNICVKKTAHICAFLYKLPCCKFKFTDAFLTALLYNPTMSEVIKRQIHFHANSWRALWVLVGFVHVSLSGFWWFFLIAFAFLVLKKEKIELERWIKIHKTEYGNIATVWRVLKSIYHDWSQSKSLLHIREWTKPADKIFLAFTACWKNNFTF